MEKIRAEIKKKLNADIRKEIESEDAIGFELVIDKKRFNFYARKGDDFRANFLLFIHRVKKITQK